MGKGEDTRQAILEHAVGLCSRIGLEALSIGQLSDDMRMSKSGLFAHFRSKENLQRHVLEEAGRQFADGVIKPAFAQARGEPRVRALFERWLGWARQPGGCMFVQVSAELDDQPGALRDVLVYLQRYWMEVLAECAHRAVREGHFRKNLDVEQFAYEMNALMLGWHYLSRLLGDPRADQRVITAFENLIDRAH